jgi:hypothetical protein
MKLLVDKDFSSDSLWIPTSSGNDWGNGNHHEMNLPLHLVDRLDYLSDWFETYNPGGDEGPAVLEITGDFTRMTKVV